MHWNLKWTNDWRMIIIKEYDSSSSSASVMWMFKPIVRLIIQMHIFPKSLQIHDRNVKSSQKLPDWGRQPGRTETWCDIIIITKPSRTNPRLCDSPGAQMGQVSCDEPEQTRQLSPRQWWCCGVVTERVCMYLYIKGSNFNKPVKM